MDSLLLKLFTHLHSTSLCVFHVPAELAGGHASSQPTNGACPFPQSPLIPPPAQRRPLSTHLHPHGSPRRGAGLRGVLPPLVALPISRRRQTLPSRRRESPRRCLCRAATDTRRYSVRRESALYAHF